MNRNDAVSADGITMASSGDISAQGGAGAGQLDLPAIVNESLDVNGPPVDDEEDIPTSFFVQAQYDFTSTDGSALSFHKGDVIEVLTQLESGWWDGLVDGKRGWMPCNYVKIISDQEAEQWFIAKETEAANGFQGMGQPNGSDDALAQPLSVSRRPDISQTWLETQAAMGVMSPNVELSASHSVNYKGPDDNDLGDGGLDALARNFMRDSGTATTLAGRGGFGVPIRHAGTQDDMAMNGADTDQSEARGNADDFWVPSLTDDGQTGEDTWEIPSLPEPSPPPSSRGGDSRTSSRRTSSRTPAIPPRLDSTASYAQVNDPREAILSPVSGAFGLPRIDTRTGLPKQLGPWLARLTDDGAGYVYVNKDTGEIRKEIPAAYASGPSAMREDANESPSRNVDPARRLSAARSDFSGPDSPGMTSSLRKYASQQLANSPTSVDPLSESLAWEKRIMEALRIKLDPSQEQGSGQLLETGRQELGNLVRQVSDCVAAVVESSQYYATLVAAESPTSPPSADVDLRTAAQALRVAVANTTPAVRELLYASRYALFGMNDLIAASIPDQITDDSRMLKIKERQRAHALSYSSPEAMHTPQRRLVAALSKIVFFCHSAAGMDWPLDGTAHRLAQDARDLEKALRAYIAEVERIGCLADVTSTGDRYAHRARGLRDSSGRMVVEPLAQGINSRAASRTSSRHPRAWRILDQSVIAMIKAKTDDVFHCVQQLQETSRSRPEEDIGRFRELFFSISTLQAEIGSIDLACSLDLDPAAYGIPALASLVEDYNALTVKASLLFKQFEHNIQTLSVSSSSLFLLLSSSGNALELDQTLKTLLTTMDAIVAGLMQFEDISRGQAEFLQLGVNGHVASRSGRSTDVERYLAGKKRMSRRESQESRMSSRRSTLSHVRESQVKGVDEGNENDPAEVTVSAGSTELGIARERGGIQPSPSQSSLNSMKGAPSLIRPRKSSNASGSASRSSSIHSLSQTVDDGRDSMASTFRSSTSGLIKAMPFLRGRGSSDADKLARSSPNKSKQKLAKVLGEESFMDAAMEPPRPPPMPEKPFYLAADYADDEIMLNPDGSVKAGTLSALVARLTTHEQLDFTFTSTFLITYRSFATGPEVVDLLCKRYAISPPVALAPEQMNDWKLRKQTPVKLRVYNVFKNWVDQYFIEGADYDILDRIRTFAAEVMANDTIKMPSEQLIRAVNRRQNDGDAVFRSPTASIVNAPQPMLPRVSTRGFQLLDIDPKELARQMTILESNLYNKIRPVDCLNKAWSQTDRPESGENIKAMILTSNRIAGWVAEAVLSHTDVKRRAITMKHFVQIAKHCKALNNFSTMAAIMAGLNSTPIRRLKRTREQLGGKTLALMDELDKSLDSGKNFAAYRESLKLITPPCIPFLGVYLTFLTFIEDGNANMIPAPTQSSSSSLSTLPSNSSLASSVTSSSISTPATTTTGSTSEPKKLIHFFKRQKSADVIREIQQYQTTPYNLVEVRSIIEWLKAKLEDVEKGGVDMYDLSCQLEPKEKEDERLARMLRESGMM